MAVVNPSAQELALLSQSVAGHMNPRRGEDPDEKAKDVPGDPFGGFQGGIITGPLMEFFGRGEAREQSRKRRSELQLSRAQSELDSSGVDLSTQRPEVISGLMSGLQDTDPKRADAARADLQEIANQQGVRPAAPVPMTPLQTQQLANATQQNAINAQNLNQEQMQTQVQQMELTRLQGGVPDTQMVLDTALKMGQQRDAQLMPYTTSLDAYNQMRTLKPGSPAAATALVFKFVSSMDNTAVRDGERAMITGQGGPMAALVNKINLYAGKGAIGDDAWNDIMETADDLAKGQFDTANRINEQWDIRAGKYAKEFMMPALVNLSQATRFNPEQQFGFNPSVGNESDTEVKSGDEIVVGGKTYIAE